MTDKPILFSGPMVQALLDGRKAQTRRMLTIKGKRGFFQFGISDTPGYDWTFRRADHVWEDYEHDRLLSLLPIVTCDRLWVREQCATWEGSFQDVAYRADLTEKDWSDLSHDARNGAPWKRRPSIHMPRWASRLTLTVTDVRVQRLQDITPDDARAEGALTGDHSVYAFSEIWNSINGPDSWNANPWIYALTFTVQRGNIDEVAT